jgi:hypothetical protein
MRRNRLSWISIAVVLGVIMIASTAAHALDFKMIIVIDASGSMVASTADGTRFDSAKIQANEDLSTVANAINLGDTFQAAVYTFTCIDLPCGPGEAMLVRHTGTDGNPFVSRNSATLAINDRTVENSVGGWTPLAGALCGAVDTFDRLFPIGTSPSVRRVMSISSDGEENSSPLSTALTPTCGNQEGQPFYTGSPPYPGYSWQKHVIDYYTGKQVDPYVNLFQLDFNGFAAPLLDPEQRALAATRSLTPTRLAANAPTPLEEFFTVFTQANGGTLRVILDGQPLPVPGDLTGDRCVDRADAVSVARAFGPLVPPTSNGKYDVNSDRTIDFTDYQIQAGRITPTCGPDPYVQRGSVACHGAARVVIDGQAIEDGGITIDARGACEITIKNSLIVSGKNAIRILGTAVLRVDNSIIVGQDAVIVQRGAGVLSAANSVFHGEFDIQGAFHYIDRGGNVFE